MNGVAFHAGSISWMGHARRSTPSTCVILCTMGGGAFKRSLTAGWIVALCATLFGCVRAPRDLAESTPPPDVPVAPSPSIEAQPLPPAPADIREPAQPGQA